MGPLFLSKLFSWKDITIMGGVGAKWKMSRNFYIYIYISLSSLKLDQLRKTIQFGNLQNFENTFHFILRMNTWSWIMIHSEGSLSQLWILVFRLLDRVACPPNPLNLRLSINYCRQICFGWIRIEENILLGNNCDGVKFSPCNLL